MKCTAAYMGLEFRGKVWVVNKVCKTFMLK